jgi:hypothetical protein
LYLIGMTCFFPNPFRFISHFTTWCSIVWLLTHHKINCKKNPLVSNFSGLLFTDKDRPTAKGYVSFAPYSAGLQKRPYDGR